MWKKLMVMIGAEDDPEEQGRLPDVRVPRTQPGIQQSQHGPMQQSQLSNSSMSSSGFFKLDDSRLWSRDGLDKIMTPKRLENYDEKFRKGLEKYGNGMRYKDVNMNVIRDWMEGVRDLYIIQMSQKKNAENIREDLENTTQEYSKSWRQMMEQERTEGSMLRDIFKLLPNSFKSRDVDKLNELTYKFFMFEKLLIIKMNEKRIQDHSLYYQVLDKMSDTSKSSEKYLNITGQLRKRIGVVRSSCEVAKKKITEKYMSKQQRAKVLYILEKISKKYKKVLQYCAKDLADVSLLNFPAYFEILLTALVNLSADCKKYSAVKVLARIAQSLGNKLIGLKKRLKNELYSEVKMIMGSTRLRRTEKVGMILEVYKKIEDKGREMAEKFNREGMEASKGVDQYIERNLLQSHYTDILLHNSSLDTTKLKELLFSSTLSSTGDSYLNYKS